MFSDAHPQYFQGIYGLLYQEIYGRVLTAYACPTLRAAGPRGRATSACGQHRFDQVAGEDTSQRPCRQDQCGECVASSTVQSKRCTEGSSSRMLSLRHSIGHRSPFGTRPGGSKSVPYVCCYASPPPTINYALIKVLTILSPHGHLRSTFC